MKEHSIYTLLDSLFAPSLLTTNLSTMTIRLTLALLAIAVPTVTSFQNGDTCGVTSRDFLNYDYRSDYMVAGEIGCSLGDDIGCFCGPNLTDGQSLGEWEWQCNGVVKFGPVSPKICPSVVPVAKGLGELESVENRNRARSLEVDKVASVGTESLQQKMGVACDTTTHPTGQPGDEVCPYSDCDEGGDHSAICACIDLVKYGMGVGMEWVCMHATCSCDEQDGQDGDLSESLGLNEDVDSKESSARVSFVSLMVSLSMLATAVLFN